MLLEFHDSYLLSLDESLNLLVLDAVIHRETSEGVLDSGMQRVQFTLQNLRASTLAFEMPFDIYSAELNVDGSTTNELLQVPSKTPGPIVLALESRNGEQLSVKGHDLHIEALSEFETYG